MVDALGGIMTLPYNLKASLLFISLDLYHFHLVLDKCSHLLWCWLSSQVTLLCVWSFIFNFGYSWINGELTYSTSHTCLNSPIKTMLFDLYLANLNMLNVCLFWLLSLCTFVYNLSLLLEVSLIVICLGCKLLTL